MYLPSSGNVIQVASLKMATETGFGVVTLQVLSIGLNY